MTPPTDSPQIRPVPPHHRAEALRLLFGRLPPAERQRQIETASAAVNAAEAATPEGLLGAYRAARLVGAVFSQIQPGKTATLWPPQITPDEPTATVATLLDVACDRLAQQQVCIVQALLRTDSSPDAAILLEGGFHRLAKLFYLVSTQDEFPRHPPSGPLDYQQYTADSHCRLAAVVQATYDQTLDCPGLNGVRQIDDVLAGYRAAGVFDPQRWLIVRHDGCDVGCLLLADHPQDGNYELVYMGLTSSGRGQGWGIQIARQAQWLTRRAGRTRLVLAVDSANKPALRIYATTGFRAWDRRSAYLKVLQPAGQ